GEDAYSRRAYLLSRSRPRRGRRLSRCGACVWGARRRRARASVKLSRRLLRRVRVGSRRSPHRGGLSRAEQPDHRCHRLTSGFASDGQAIVSNSAPRTGDVYLKFTGVDSYVEIGSIEDYSIATTGELSVSAWIRPDTLNFSRWESTRYVHWLGKGAGTG